MKLMKQKYEIFLAIDIYQNDIWIHRTRATTNRESFQQENASCRQHGSTLTNGRHRRIMGIWKSSAVIATYTSSIARKRENSRNFNVLLICGLFIICLAPRFPLYFYFSEFAEWNEQCSPIFRNLSMICIDNPNMINETIIFITPKVSFPKELWAISPIANLGLLINSASNWIIYIYAGTRFRKVFIRKLLKFFCILCKE